jgi:hypothetical protein
LGAFAERPVPGCRRRLLLQTVGQYIPWSDLHYLPGSGPYGPTIYPWTTDPLNTQQDSTCMVRVGKKAAGRLLDGRTWDELPQVEVSYADA